MRRTKWFWTAVAGMVLLGGVLIGCQSEEEKEEDGAIVEGTVLVGWDNPKGKIRVPDGVTVIGSYALNGKTEITRVTIPNSVLTIKEDAFSRCSSLGSVVFEGNGLRSIDGWAFNNCTSLTSITIPDSVESIDVNAFRNCNNLTTVYATGEWEEYWTSIGRVDPVGQLTADVLTKGGLVSYFRRVTE